MSSDIDKIISGQAFKNLVLLGKEKGFLTYADVNEFLPDEMNDLELIDEIVQRLDDLGITVLEMSTEINSIMGGDQENEGVINPNLVVEQATQVFSSNTELELGRTTDPVRMYMREMGTVELLTRQDEIDIAKRIELGIREVLMTMAEYPKLLNLILEDFSKVEEGKLKVTDLVNGFIEPDSAQVNLEQNINRVEQPKSNLELSTNESNDNE